MLTNFVANTACKLLFDSRKSFLKNAPCGRFFVSALLCTCFSLLSFTLPALEFVNTQHHETELHSNCGIGTNTTHNARIGFVIDGDTVVTKSGEKIRLIGIDTPELGHGNIAPAAGAIAARVYLERMLSREKTIQVVYGTEPSDKHGRHLGHLFLSDGTNVQAKLLSSGYAVPLTVPPNLAYLSCYVAQANNAMQQKLGLWRLAQYKVIPVSKLKRNERGYRLVEGTISRLGESQSSIWLSMGRNFAARILKTNLHYFTAYDLKSFVGKQVYIRGMVYQRKGQLRIQLRHPADLILK